MVGDHHNDVLAAKGAGVKSIFASWGYGPADTGDHADAVATGFPEIVTIAARLIAA
jgi:phosphoglycolate phosphatase